MRDSVSFATVRHLRFLSPSAIGQSLCLVFLLIAGQQGALVHEMGHLTAARTQSLDAQSDQAAETACALCPSFAQAASPTFSYSFDFPSLAPAQIEKTSAVLIESAGSAVPTPRSRGPPSLT
jgi:hypothetical protein